MQQLIILSVVLFISSYTNIHSAESHCPCTPKFMAAFNGTPTETVQSSASISDVAQFFHRCQAPKNNPCRCASEAGALLKMALNTKHAIPTKAVAAHLAAAVRAQQSEAVAQIAQNELLPATPATQSSQMSHEVDGNTTHPLLAYEIQPSCPDDALPHTPADNNPHKNLLVGAHLCITQQKYNAARALYEKILAQDNNNYEAHRGMALILRKEENLTVANMHVQAALLQQPHNNCLRRELGFLCMAQGDLIGARDAYATVVAQTNDPASRCAIAYTYKLEGNIQQAITEYRNILVDNQGYTPAQYGLAKALLIAGNHVEGYEMLIPFLRASDQFYTDKTEELRTAWKKNGTVSGATIVLHATPKSGQGDSLEFIPFYERLLREAGNRVIVVAPKSLVSIFSRTMPHVQTADQPLPAHDYIVSAMSAPAVCNTTRSDIDNTPRLKADPNHVAERAQQMAEREKQLGNTNALKVAFCWQADVNNDKTRLPIGRRSILPLDPLKKMVTTPGTSFYSLLLDNSALTQVPWGDSVYKFSGDFDKTHGAYEDTAAVIVNSDLIISVDTSLPHLAASLGKEVWVLLPREADFRWQENGETVWYDKKQVKVFRSIDALEKALAEKVRAHQASK